MICIEETASRWLPGRCPHNINLLPLRPQMIRTLSELSMGQYRLFYSEHWIIIPDLRQEILYKSSSNWLPSWAQESHSPQNSNTFRIPGINGTSDLKMIQRGPETSANGNGTSTLKPEDAAQFIKLPDVSLCPIIGRLSLTMP